MANKYLPLALVLFVNLIPSDRIFANVHFTLKGTLSDSNYGLLTQANHAASASIEFDIGNYLRLGVTHRQARGLSEGYYEVVKNLYEYRISKTQELANSLDLSVILYYGEIFVPYLQVGLVKKDYVIAQNQSDGSVLKDSISLPPIPNGGFGIGIRLNRNFSLKLSQTFSKAIKIPYPNAEPIPALDTYSSVGISYSL